MPSGNSEHRLDRIISAIEADLKELKHRRDTDQPAKETKRRHLRVIDGGKSRVFVLVLGALGLLRLIRMHPVITAATVAATGALTLGAVLLPNVIGTHGHDRHGAIPTAPAPVPSSTPASPSPSPANSPPSHSPGMRPSAEPMPAPTVGEIILPPRGATPTPTATSPAGSPPIITSMPPPMDTEQVPPRHCLIGLDGAITLANLRTAVRLGLCGADAT